MQLTSLRHEPAGAALIKWTTRVMDVILHLGAHRTATTSFQYYMQRHAIPLAEQGVGYWGPQRSRRGVFSGTLPSGTDPAQDVVVSKDVRSRVDRHLEQARQRGVQTLIVSDENMIGGLRCNISAKMLYADAGSRLTTFAKAFDGCISAMVFSPRSLENYWCSVLSHGVALGQDVPERADLRDIAMHARGWRDVISDIAQAVPGVPLRILPFERFMGQPDVFLAQGAHLDTPFDTQRSWLNRAPTLPDLRRILKEKGGAPVDLPFGMGRWNPFTNEENAALRERHADDIMWLTAGAEGMATLTEDSLQSRAGPTPPFGGIEKGQSDELEERQLARPG